MLRIERIDRWRLAAIALAALAGGCLSGTNVPGMRRCLRVFVVIGYYTECEEGPPWSAVQLPPPPATIPTHMPSDAPTPGRSRSEGAFCFYAIPENGRHAVETCFDTLEECRQVQGIVKAPATVTIECQQKAP